MIGNGTSIGDDCHITSTNRIIIGNNVLIGRRVLITDNSHGQCIYEDLLIEPLNRDLYSKGGIVIDDHVWIGEKATILSGVHIGKELLWQRMQLLLKIFRLTLSWLDVLLR